MAFHWAGRGLNVLWLISLAEPNEKFLTNLSELHFFDGRQIGVRIQLVNLSRYLRQGVTEKLQAIRDEVKKEEGKWRADHAADLKKIQDDMAAAAQDREQMRQVMTQRRELMQTMPKTDDAAQKVKALLTDDQAKALDARIAERQEEMRSRMGGMMGGRGGRGGGGGQ
jgi:Spy/CpxP family protein refolding chaperone